MLSSNFLEFLLKKHSLPKSQHNTKISCFVEQRSRGTRSAGLFCCYYFFCSQYHRQFFNRKTTIINDGTSIISSVINPMKYAGGHSFQIPENNPVMLIPTRRNRRQQIGISIINSAIYAISLNKKIPNPIKINKIASDNIGICSNLKL